MICLLPEKELIEHVRHLAGRGKGREIVRGIGDDCAILQIRPGDQVLVTTDLCVEGVHFRREWHPAHSVGHRCLARGLSDIAAMGGRPVSCFLSLAVPSTLPQKWMNEFLRGLLQLAGKFDVTLAGGDTSSGEKITADIVVLGTIPAGKALLRSGAHPGDEIYVTGELGGPTAVLNRLLGGKKVRPTRDDRHFYPKPRVEVGQWLRQRNLGSAMIDLSDGLSVDLAHLCEESRVSALVEANAIPVSKQATLDQALHGGDDYELVFTVKPGVKIPGEIHRVAVTKIGKILPGASSGFRVQIRGKKGPTKFLKAKGWQHFARI